MSPKSHTQWNVHGFSQSTVIIDVFFWIGSRKSLLVCFYDNNKYIIFILLTSWAGFTDLHSSTEVKLLFCKPRYIWRTELMVSQETGDKI